MIARDIPSATRADLLKGQSSHALVAHIRVSSPLVSGGVNIVSDTVAHTVDGVTYDPIGVGIATPRENDDASPRQSLTLPDTDRRLGMALRSTTETMRISIDWYTMADFDITVIPRVPLDGASPIVSQIDWLVVDVSAQLGSVSLTIEQRNIDQEPFPQVRATRTVAPGLHK